MTSRVGFFRGHVEVGARRMVYRNKIERIKNPKVHLRAGTRGVPGEFILDGKRTRGITFPKLSTPHRTLYYQS